MNRNLFSLSLFSLLTAICLILMACGGGGGGGGSDVTVAAQVDISVEPGRIDPGDRALVTIHASDVNAGGIVLKVRFPEGLAYVKNTGSFVINGEKLILTPDFNSSDGQNVYLAFLFAQSDFGEDGTDEATITFQIQGNTSPVTGLVEVDATIQDPSLTADQQFDINNPLFGAKDSDSINVGQSSTTPTAAA